MTPLVSVVVPAFNAERYIHETIRSVQAQDFSRWRLVVLDDGSTDRTAPIMARLADQDDRIELLRQANQGVAAARNRGFSTTNAPYILFLDADDLLRPHALTTLFETLTRRHDCAAAYGLAEYINEEGQLIRQGEAQRWARKNRKVRQGLRIRQLQDDEPATFESLVLGNSIRSPRSPSGASAPSSGGRTIRASGHPT